MRREATLNDDEKSQCARLQAQERAVAEAIALTQDFAALVRQRQPDQLETWLERATASGLQAFKSFCQWIEGGLCGRQSRCHPEVEHRTR
jgi:transposase